MSCISSGDCYTGRGDCFSGFGTHECAAPCQGDYYGAGFNVASYDGSGCSNDNAFLAGMQMGANIALRMFGAGKFADAMKMPGMFTTAEEYCKSLTTKQLEQRMSNPLTKTGDFEKEAYHRMSAETKAKAAETFKNF